jgi:hypothetical protein
MRMRLWRELLRRWLRILLVLDIFGWDLGCLVALLLEEGVKIVLFLLA